MTSELDRRAHDVVSQLHSTDSKSREQLLNEKCCGDFDLQKAVERLWARQQATSDREDPEASSSAPAGDELPTAMRATLDASDVASDGDSGVQPAQSTGLVGTRFSRLEKLGQGGQGEVWLALDPLLDRHVAIKVIRPSLRSSRTARAKFRRESEVTGKLEHPGIVPIYEAWCEDAIGDCESTPFYVMRVYHGRTLHDAIKAFHANKWSEADLRKLLLRFIDVCNAVSYAHSRGVIHRDLKPQNVMLGDFGETLVVDWGLARIVGRDEIHAVDDGSPVTLDVTPAVSETADGSILGTPQYMSPEQARGEIETLGPRSDVYSLGAILFRILTGRPTVTGTSVYDVLDDVKEGRIERPRIVNASVPKSLSAICRKALALKPGDRYPSAAALAEDVSRWMNDETVEAFPESMLSRSRRWIRTHPTLTATTAVAVQMAVVTLVIMIAVISGKNAQLGAANLELNQANSSLTNAIDRERRATLKASDSASEAIRKRQEAIAAQQRAESSEEAAREAQQKAEANAAIGRQQTQLAVDTLRTVIFDIQRDLKHEPKHRQLRRKLLQTALQRLREIADEFADAGNVNRQTSAALSEMAELVLEIGLDESDLVIGNFDTTSAVEFARWLRRRVVQIDRNLAEAAPGDTQAQRNLSISYEQLGNVHLRTGAIGSAITCFRTALEINRRLAESASADLQAQRDLSISYQKLGDLHLQTSEFSEAMDAYRECHSIRERLLQTEPDSADARRELAISHIQLGDISLTANAVDAARESYQAARTALELLAEGQPADVNLRRDLSVLSNKQGAASLRAGALDAAANFYETSLELARSLASGDVDQIEAQRDLSVSYFGIGDVRLRTDDCDLALEAYRAGHSIFLRLAVNDPADASAQNDLVVSYFKLGEAYRSEYGYREAARQYQSGLAILARMIAATQNNEQFRVHRNRFNEATQLTEAELTRALQEWDRLMLQPAATLPLLLSIRCVEFARQRRPADVAQAADKLSEVAAETQERQSLYQAACAYAWCASNGLQSGQQRFLERSLKCLQQAVRAGFNDPARLRRDRRLSSVREMPEFQNLLQSAGE